MHFTVLFRLAVVAASLCSSAMAGEPYALSDQQRTAVEGEIKRLLKDPDSAKFEAFGAATQTAGDVTICGTVNAKNAFGGYVGAMPFRGHIWPPDQTFYVDDFASSESDGTRIVALCKGAGAL